MDSTNTPLMLRHRAIAGMLILGAALVEPQVAVATTCSTVAACIYGLNSEAVFHNSVGSDSGVAGESRNGDGIDGATTFASSSSAARSGVAGYDLSASGQYNNGVFGFSGSGTGMHGSTNTGAGVSGTATSSGTGVQASSSTGTALAATTIDGLGLGIGDTETPYQTVEALSLQVVGDGIDITNDYGPSLGGFAGPMGSGAGFSSAGGDALDIDETGTGVPLLLNGNSEIQESGVIDLDDDLVLAGGLTTYGAPAQVTRTATGAYVRAYTARETEAEIEDVGETSVSAGRGAVAIDPAFGSTIDSRKPYYVFLTAEGDNRGLYVTAKSSHGFAIRETNGGTSTLNVQYRIVAKPFDAQGAPRLAALDPAKLPYANAAARQHLADLRAHEAEAAAAAAGAFQ